MWKFLLFISAVIVWPGSAQGERVFLATHENWAFYKVLATGQMVGENLKETCEAAGMRYVCYYTRAGRCDLNRVSGCISFHRLDTSCKTLAVLSSKLCGNTDYLNCQALDDIFLYSHIYEGGSWGMDYDTHVEKLPGEDYNDKYTVCAEVSNCASSPCEHGTCSDDGLGSFTCTPCEEGTSCDLDEQVYLTTHDAWAFFKVLATGPMTQGNVRATCEAAGMSYPCFGAGQGSCFGSGCTCNTKTWSNDCITFDVPDGSACLTFCALSTKLCGNNLFYKCRPLDGTFVPISKTYSSTLGANGVKFGPHNDLLNGYDHYNKYALCAKTSECLSSPCVRGTCTDSVGGYTCSCESGWTGRNCDQDRVTNVRAYSSASCATGMYYTLQHSMFPCIMLFSIHLYAWIQIRMF